MRWICIILQEGPDLTTLARERQVRKLLNQAAAETNQRRNGIHSHFVHNPGAMAFDRALMERRSFHRMARSAFTRFSRNFGKALIRESEQLCKQDRPKPLG
jgi:hypothetical protein